MFKQIAMRLATGIAVFDARYARVYATIVVATATLALARERLPDEAPAVLVIAVVVSLSILVLNRASLRMGDTFPELLRVPVARRLFG